MEDYSKLHHSKSPSGILKPKAVSTRFSKENDRGFYRDRQLRGNFSHRHHLGHQPSRRRAPPLSQRANPDKPQSGRSKTAPTLWFPIAPDSFPEIDAQTFDHRSGTTAQFRPYVTTTQLHPGLSRITGFRIPQWHLSCSTFTLQAVLYRNYDRKIDNN